MVSILERAILGVPSSLFASGIAAIAANYFGRSYAKFEHLPVDQVTKAWIIWNIAHSTLPIFAIHLFKIAEKVY
jgi:hypothetical protein